MTWLQLNNNPYIPRKLLTIMTNYNCLLEPSNLKPFGKENCILDHHSLLIYDISEHWLLFRLTVLYGSHMHQLHYDLLLCTQVSNLPAAPRSLEQIARNK